MKLLYSIVSLILISPLIVAQSSSRVQLAYTVNNEKSGFIDHNGKPIIPIEFDQVKVFSEGLIAVNQGAKKVNYEKKGGKWGFWNQAGQEVIPLKYEDARSFSEGLAAVKLNGKYGFINPKGQVVVDFRYDRAKSFSQGLAAVQVGKKWGFIDRQGNLNIKPSFDEVQSFQQGLAIVFHQNNQYNYDGSYGRFGLVNKQGKLVLDTIYQGISRFKNGLARVESGKKTGFVNTQGKIVIPIQYDSANDFSEGLAAVAKYIIVDPSSKPAYSREQIDSIQQVVKKKFPRPGAKEMKQLFKDPKFVAFVEQQRGGKRKQLKYGYINKQGKLIIDYQFKYAEPFKNGVANIKYRDIPGSGVMITDQYGNEVPTYPPHPNDRYNAVNRNGQLLTLNGTTITLHQQQLIIRRVQQGTGIFNHNGDEVFAPGQYHSIKYLGNGFFTGENEKNGNKTLFTLNSTIASDPNFEKIEAAPNNRFIVSYAIERNANRVQTKTGIMDAKGKWILKPTYQLIAFFDTVD